MVLYKGLTLLWPFLISWDHTQLSCLHLDLSFWVVLFLHSCFSANCTMFCHSLSTPPTFIANFTSAFIQTKQKQRRKSESKWLLIAIHSPSVCLTVSQIDPADTSTEKGNRSLLTEAVPLWLRTTWKAMAALNCIFWNAERSSGTLGLRFLHCQVQPGERNSSFAKKKSCSDGWVILSSVCNSSPSVSCPTPTWIWDCVSPPSWLHKHIQGDRLRVLVPGPDSTVTHTDLRNLCTSGRYPRWPQHSSLAVNIGEWRETGKKKVQGSHNYKEKWM